MMTRLVDGVGTRMTGRGSAFRRVDVVEVGCCGAARVSLSANRRAERRTGSVLVISIQKIGGL
jgi:hypothetical protein